MFPEEFQYALELLGITAQDLDLLYCATSQEEVEGIREALLQKAKKQQRKAAKILHPDVNRGDVVKTQAFMGICDAIEYLANLQVRSRLVVRVRIVQGPRGPESELERT